MAYYGGAGTVVPFGRKLAIVSFATPSLAPLHRSKSAAPTALGIIVIAIPARLGDVRSGPPGLDETNRRQI